MMKKFLLIMILISPVFGSLVVAEELTEEKKQLIDEMLGFNGVKETGLIMGRMFSNQISNVIKKNKPNVKLEILEMVEEEANKVIEEMLFSKSGINVLMYPIYHKYLSLEELKAVVAFYKTPAGRKLLSVTPEITQEAMIAGQKFGKSLGPVIMERVKDRLKKEGVDLSKI